MAKDTNGAVAERAPRTHLVAGRVLYGAKLYVAGETVAFGDDVTDETIQDLINNGNLDGEVARKHAMQRFKLEMDTGMHAMSEDDLQKMWRGYLRMTTAERKQREAIESRTKDDLRSVKLANADDPATPVEA